MTLVTPVRQSGGPGQQSGPGAVRPIPDAVAADAGAELPAGVTAGSPLHPTGHLRQRRQTPLLLVSKPQASFCLFLSPPTDTPV